MVSAVIVDDEESILDIFTDMLKLIDVNVLGSGINGKEAIDLYTQHTPDVLFIDLMMPDYDGFYALEELKKSAPDAKIVVVTADLREETKERLDKLGVTSVLSKPYNLEQIRQILVDDLKIQL